MKIHIRFIFFAIVFLLGGILGCNPTKKNFGIEKAIYHNSKEEQSKKNDSVKTVHYSITPVKDSLARINFYDFYQKPLSKLLENKMIKTFDEYSFLPDKSNCLHYCHLTYKTVEDEEFDLKITFARIKHISNYCDQVLTDSYGENYVRYPDLILDSVKNEKIRSVELLYPTKSSLTFEVAESIKRIKFDSYKGKSINQLLNETNLLKYSRPSFYGEQNCLKRIIFHFHVKDSDNFILILYKKNFEKMNPCIDDDLHYKTWNFNEIRLEEVEEVKILPSM